MRALLGLTVLTIVSNNLAQAKREPREYLVLLNDTAGALIEKSMLSQNAKLASYELTREQQAAFESFRREFEADPEAFYASQPVFAPDILDVDNLKYTQATAALELLLPVHAHAKTCAYCMMHSDDGRHTAHPRVIEHTTRKTCSYAVQQLDVLPCMI